MRSTSQHSRHNLLVSKLVLWAQSTTKDYIRAEHKLHSIVELFISQVIIPQVMFFLAYSAGTQHGNLHPTGWPILFCGPTLEPVLATANAGEKKSGEVLEKNAGEWNGRVEIKKKFLAVSVACMAIYWPTPGFKGRTFKLCVFARWDFNFCVSSSPLRGQRRKVVTLKACRERGEASAEPLFVR